MSSAPGFCSLHRVVASVAVAQGLGDGFQQSLAQCATFTTVTADAEAVGCALAFGFGPLTFAKVALLKAGCVHWIMNTEPP